MRETKEDMLDKLNQAYQKKIILIGHSAMGKSLILNKLGLPREKQDMDKFCSIKKLPYDLRSFELMVSDMAEIPLFVLSNDKNLLLSIFENKSKYADFCFIYLHRPFQLFLDNLKRINTDGQRHKPLTDKQAENHYNVFDKYYKDICDIELGLYSKDIDEILSDIKEVLRREL